MKRVGYQVAVCDRVCWIRDGFAIEDDGAVADGIFLEESRSQWVIETEETLGCKLT